MRYKCATRKREKETGGGICFQFPPSGRCILLFMAGRGVFFFFPRRDGAVVVFFRGGTGWLFFFFSTGRDGAVFFFFRGPGRDGCFWRWQCFWRDGAKSLHRPAKGGLNRPASRPCKALIKTSITTHPSPQLQQSHGSRLGFNRRSPPLVASLPWKQAAKGKMDGIVLKKSLNHASRAMLGIS